MPLKTVWLSQREYEKIKELNLNFSRFVRERLHEYFKSQGIEIENDDPELIIKVKCPFCGFEQNTTTVRTVRCFECGRQYRVYKKSQSRIVKIVKGSLQLLFKKYYEAKKGRA